MKAEVGYRIRKLRESKDLSQENMAGELNISSGAYSKIETGKTDPSINRLAQIAKILEVDIIYFFSDGMRNAAQDRSELYGFATKLDIEEISKQIKQIKEQLAELRQKKTIKQPVAAKKKTRS